MTMTPEERAAKALMAVYEETMSKHQDIQSCRSARTAIVASAIRSAQTDAREKALDEVAQHFDRIGRPGAAIEARSFKST